MPASTIVVRPSEQSRKTSPSRGLDGEDVDVDVGLGPERARDHRALRVDRRLLGRELAAAHELGDERVVVGQLLELLVAQPVGARVADMADRDLPVGLEHRDGHRRAHPRGCRVGRGALVDAQVRGLDQRDDALLAAWRRVELGLGDGARRERRGDLAGLGAAHPVRDGEHRAAPRRSCPRCAAACARHSTPPPSWRFSSLEPQVGLADPDDVAGDEAPVARRGGCR